MRIILNQNFSLVSVVVKGKFRFLEREDVCVEKYVVLFLLLLEGYEVICDDENNT